MEIVFRLLVQIKMFVRTGRITLIVLVYQYFIFAWLSPLVHRLVHKLVVIGEETIDCYFLFDYRQEVRVVLKVKVSLFILLKHQITET